MKAAVVWEAAKPMTIEDVTIFKPKNREVIVNTAYAGITIIGGEIRLALAAVNDQGFDFKPTPLTQLNGGGKNRPTHADDAGFFHQTGQLFLRNAVRVFVRVQLDPFLQAVGFQQYSSRR